MKNNAPDVKQLLLAPKGKTRLIPVFHVFQEKGLVAVEKGNYLMQPLLA
jgi:hypothetical protein